MNLSLDRSVLSCMKQRSKSRKPAFLSPHKCNKFWATTHCMEILPKRFYYKSSDLLCRLDPRLNRLTNARQRSPRASFVQQRSFSTTKKEDEETKNLATIPQLKSTGSAILSAAERLIDETHKTSGRKHRRLPHWKKRRKRQQKSSLAQQKEKDSAKEDDEESDDGIFTGLPKPPVHDTRTVMDLIFPNPYKNEPLPPNTKKWPTTFSGWRRAFAKTWDMYRWTWRGFFTSRGFLVEDELDKKFIEENKKDETKLTTSPDEVIENVRRNAEFAKEEALKIRATVREKTGIESKEDMKRWVAAGMKLFSECVKEFMAGYRKGRDDEVEKMLTQYFQNLEEQANKPKRRRIKARVRNRTQRIIQQRYLRTCR